MKLVVGLGNPGVRYENTRHNAGFFVAERLQESKYPKGVVVKRSDVFMNDSGKFVEKLLGDGRIQESDLYVIHDDLDIRLGEYKIQFGKGPKDHNGLKSVDDELGTDQYWHVRVGVDNRDSSNRVDGEEYVLQNFSMEENVVLEGIVKKVVQDLCKKLAT
jgi:PTH1 family peptidyl-tRNA hydrolase